MQLSALLVTVDPARFDAYLDTARRMPGVDVHHVDTVRHRAILTIEAVDADESMDRFNALNRLEGCLTISLVEHRFDDDAESA